MHPSPEKHSFPAQPIPDWSQLARHDAVTVLREDGSCVSGLVDMIAYDRSVFWVIQNAGLGRIMICSQDQAQIIKTGPGPAHA